MYKINSYVLMLEFKCFNTLKLVVRNIYGHLKPLFYVISFIRFGRSKEFEVRSVSWELIDACLFCKI